MKKIRYLFPLVLLVGLACANKARIYYVATDGLDTNPGTWAKPFATIEQARDVIQHLGPYHGDIKVFIRQGEYRLAQTLIFTPQHSGAAGFTISYSAYADDTVKISGGFRISDWHQQEKNIWTTRIDGIAHGQRWFRELYRDGERLPRSRFPNDTMLTIDKASPDAKQIGFREALPKFIGPTAELVVLQNWSISRNLIYKADAHSVNTSTPCGWVGHEWTTAQPGKRAFLEHSLDFLDQPGEWYLERNSGILYYQAAWNEDPNEHVFTAPGLDQLLVLAGQRGTPVTNLHFENLLFEYANWNLPDVGYAGIQACFFGPSFEKEPTYGLPLAVELDYAEKCSFVRCTVQHTGASGLGLTAGCRNISISGCEFFDIGGNGVMVGWRAKEDRPPRQWFENDWTDQADVPANNSISNCYVHRCGAQLFGAVGIFSAFAQNTRINHNLVTDLPYSGISIGFRWDTTATSQRECLVEKNHIHDVMKILADGGGIYTLGYQPGTVLSGNLIHNVHRSNYTHGGAPNNGIFFDQGSKKYLIERNIIYDTAEEAIRFNQNKKEWHTWKDNSFGVAPPDPRFPQELAKCAGIESQFTDILSRKHK